MAQNKRILFIAGEVAPFAEVSETAQLVRMLPEQLQNNGDFEARITMPRYGTIDERSNRLHEVIRLSGTEVTMGDATETLTVKVASIPDIRLQVYFMDHSDYFGRDAIATNDDGDVFDDNSHRALFFNRSVLETIRKLRWAPDIVHAFGWAGSLTPLLMHTEYAGDDVLGNAKVVYTPDAVDTDTVLTPAFAEAMQLQIDDLGDGQSLMQLGVAHADAAIYPSSLSTNGTSAYQFEADADARLAQLTALYDEMLSEVPA